MAAMAMFWPGLGRSTPPVDLILILAIDVSGSVDHHEYDLQRRGFVKAFRNKKILEAIARGATKQIASMSTL